jgi:MarR family transcriptional regulator, organic hydroperoxide resistance regulator
MVSFMKASAKRNSIAKLVARFLGEMHRHDAGRTLPLLHAAKLTTTQLAALEFVSDPRSISDVASFLGLSLPATSQMIHKLVRRGLVRRSESVSDRREKTVLLGARGKILIEKISSARATRFAASISLMPPRSVARLKGALQEAVRHIEKSGTTAWKSPKPR